MKKIIGILILIFLISTIPTDTVLGELSVTEYVFVVDSPENATKVSQFIDDLGGEITYVKNYGVGRVYAKNIPRKFTLL